MNLDCIFCLFLQRLTPAEVDLFLCCGQSYRTIRDGVGQVMHDGKTDSLKEALQVTAYGYNIYNTKHYLVIKQFRLIWRPHCVCDDLIKCEWIIYLRVKMHLKCRAQVCICFTCAFLFQATNGPLKNVMLTLAVFRQVTCHFMSPERALDPEAQVKPAYCFIKKNTNYMWYSNFIATWNSNRFGYKSLWEWKNIKL